MPGFYPMASRSRGWRNKSMSPTSKSFMILRHQLRRLAQDSLTDAEILRDNQRWKGAYYLCGYAIEIALKERIFDVPSAETRGEHAHRVCH